MASQQDKRVFGILRPYCVNLSKLALAPPELFDPTSQQVTEALKDVYLHFRDSVDANAQLSTTLADYIFVPLSYLLKQPKLGDQQMTYLLRILTLIIAHSWSTPESFPYVLAKQLFPLITFLTGGSPNTGDKSEIDGKSNELKTAGSETLQRLFESLSIQKGNKVYDFFSHVENLPALGHVVTVLLEFAHNSKSIDLQIQALQTLRTLYFKLINDGEILSYILPGNVSTLIRITATTGNKVHFTVLVESLEILEKLLIIVYDDNDLQVDFKEIEDISEIADIVGDFDQIRLDENSFKKNHRAKPWLKATANQVKLALQNVKKLYNHDKYEVRLQLSELCKGILNHCLYSLNSSIPIIIETLAYLSKDPRLHINPKHIFQSDNPKKQAIFDKLISNEFDNFVETFTSVIQSPNESKILSNIGAIKFAIQLTSDDFVISKLVDTSIIEMSDLVNKSLSKSKITTMSTNIDDLMLITKNIKKLRFEKKALTVYDKALTDSVQLALSELFQSLGEQIDPSDIIENLVQHKSKTLVEKGISLWISNCLIRGYMGKIKNQLITDEFLDFGDSLNTSLTQIPDYAYSLLDYSREILDELSEQEVMLANEQVCSVALDTIGTVANLLGNAFQDELIDYLYPVIDSIASPSEIVREHALNTSMIIADNLYSGSLHELIINNADYLVDSISVRLSNAITTRTTAILAVCVKIAGFKIVETFKDVMEIIFSLLDHYHGYTDICIGFFVLFEIIADEIKNTYMKDIGLKKLEFHESSTTYAPWGLKNIKQLFQLLDKQNRDILVEPEARADDVEAEIGAPLDSDDDDDDEQINAGPEKETWPSPVPEEAYKLLQQVVYYGERLLTHPSKKLQIQILRTYKKIIPIFATSIKNLYPITASIWPVVSHLLNSDDVKVVIAAAEIVTQLVEYTGSFVSQRFIELWRVLKTNKLLITAAKQAIDVKKVVLPGLNSKCYEALVEMLVTSLNSLGRYVPDIITEQIIRSCIGVVDVERFDVHSDIAWIIKHETFKNNEKLDQPKDFNGYKFATIT